MFENIKKVKNSNRLENIKNTFKKISPRQRVLDNACDIADLVLSKEEKYSKLSDKELTNLSYRMMDDIKENNKNVDNYLVDGLAIAREMIFRVHGLKAFRTQLIGAIVTHFGDFAEMATGEGKTLVLLLVSYVNALTKKGVHIVTVNEYLVERDAEFSKAALSKLGISVGFIKASMMPNQKKEMYNCDITYVSNSELGFDYLRDNMVQNYEEKMQRSLNFAIVDEADSVLIDEARTPLIIAGSPNSDLSLYKEADAFVKNLHPSEYVIDLESQSINLNDIGIKKAEKFFNVSNLYDVENSEIVHRVMNALRANYMMELGREYIIKHNHQKNIDEIALVDAFTGRVMEGRTYSAGLHQAIQAKENVEIEPENVTVAIVTYQTFFRMYKKLAGVSGTALTEKNEILNIYNMTVVNIPTNKPKQRIDHPDYVFATKQLKWKYVVADIKKRNSIGQPILVGTVSVEDSELLHKMLEKIGIKHEVLNAKNNAKEAEIISRAGQKYAVTIATNMAGRGTDIKLGPGVAELGGLYVLGTERNESRRIDNQLRGRSGRQGDPGESRFFISLQDLLFKRFATDLFDKAQYKLGEEVIDLKFFSKMLTRTQKKVENMNFDIRKNLIDYDYVLSEQRELFYKQRDSILLSNNIIEIIFRMVPRIVETLITLNRHKENIDMVNTVELVKDIHKKCGVWIDFDHDFYKKKTTNEIFTKVSNELKLQIFNRYKAIGKEQANFLWRKIAIEAMDKNWTRFLDLNQKLRDSVSLRSFEQKSPLNIYIEDSDFLFFNITIDIANECVSKILSATTQVPNYNINENATPINLSINNDLKKTINTNFENLTLSNNAINKEYDKINNVMEKNNTNNLDKINDVVDEILTKMNNTSENNRVKKPELEEIFKKSTLSEDKTDLSNDQNDFMNQVLNVVNNDIKPEVALDVKELEKNLNADEPKNNNVKFAPPPPPPPPPIQTNTFKQNTVNDFNNNDNLGQQTISLNDDFFQNQNNSLELNKLKIVREELTKEIYSLKKQINDMSSNFLNKQINQEMQFQNILKQENSELKDIHQRLLDTIKEQEDYKKEQLAKCKELDDKYNKLKIEEEIKKRVEEELQKITNSRQANSQDLLDEAIPQTINYFNQLENNPYYNQQQINNGYALHPSEETYQPVYNNQPQQVAQPAYSNRPQQQLKWVTPNNKPNENKVIPKTIPARDPNIKKPKIASFGYLNSVNKNDTKQKTIAEIYKK